MSSGLALLATAKCGVRAPCQVWRSKVPAQAVTESAQSAVRTRTVQAGTTGIGSVSCGRPGGHGTPVSFLWDFGGARTVSPLAIFAERPVVAFDLEPGERSKSFTVSLTAFDTLGLRRTATASLTVVRSGPPSVSLSFDGIALGPLETLTVPVVSLQGAVQLGSEAFDEDGLGFPVFAAFGNTTPVSYIWDFGGGVPSSPLAIFTPSPVVTFPIAPGEQPSFTINLTVFDATGQSTTRTLLLRTVSGATAPVEPLRAH